MKKYEAKLVEKKEVAEFTHELTFELTKEELHLKSGQYINILLRTKITDGRGPLRSFSICSAPNPKKFSIVFRLPDSPSEFKKYLTSSKIGELVDVLGPFGKFFVPPPENIVMIAGGVGIAPFKSLILDPLNSQKNITLIYTDKNEQRMAYLSELKKLSNEKENFSLVYRFQRVDLDYILKNSPENSSYMVCGTPQMVKGVSKILTEAGIDKKKIIVEDFTGY